MRSWGIRGIRDSRDSRASRYAPITHAGLIEEGARLHPARELVFDGSARLTYGQCFARARSLAGELARLGIREGDKAIICIPNWVEFCVIYCACQMLGLTVIPLIASIREKNSRIIAEQIKPALVFLSTGEHADIFSQSSSDPLILGVRFGAESLGATGLLRYEDMIGADADAAAVGAAAVGAAGGKASRTPPPPRAGVDAAAASADTREAYPPYSVPEDSETIIYTSGSSSEPKGVVLKGSALYFAAFHQSKAMRISHDDVFLTPITFAHVFGIGAGLLMPLLAGVRIVLCDRFQPQTALRLIAEEGVSVHLGVPTMFIREMKDDSFGREDLSSLRTGLVAGSLCPPGLIEEFEQKTGCRLVCAYGLTETSSTVTTTRLDDESVMRFSTVGHPVEGVQLALINVSEEVGHEQPIGEVVCQTPGIMEGYYQDEAMTAEVLSPDGWFKTGDLGTLEADGTLRIVGRRKNTINRGGFNIHPEEIEAFYRQNEDLVDVCLIEYPDPELGERTGLFVQLAPDACACGEVLRGWSAKGLEKFKIPDRIVFVQSMPRLGSGKVDRRLLKRKLLELMEVSPCC
jgi:acyl-CoA synthetase (AMP-forming)/AMP-acid ligase II